VRSDQLRHGFKKRRGNACSRTVRKDEAARRIRGPCFGYKGQIEVLSRGLRGDVRMKDMRN
jgi:hypothetical protein